jgi:hypothetical protein
MIVFAKVNPLVHCDYQSRIELRQLFAYVGQLKNYLEPLRGAPRSKPWIISKSRCVYLKPSRVNLR